MKINRLHAFILTALVIAASNRAWAAPMEEVSPESESAMTQGAAFSANIPSKSMVSNLQELMRTPVGENWLAQNPALRIFENINPKSQVQRSIIGAAGLPTGFAGQIFTSQLIAAAKESDGTALKNVDATLQNIFGNQEAGAKIAQAADERAMMIKAGITQGTIRTMAQFHEAASELAPFAPISKKAESVMALTTAVSLTDARNIAAALLENRVVTDLAGNLYVINKGDITVYNAKRHYKRVIHTGQQKPDITIDADGHLHITGHNGHEVHDPHGNYLRMYQKPSKAGWRPNIPAIGKIFGKSRQEKQSPSRETISLDTMNKISHGHDFLYKGMDLGNGAANADLLRELNGKNFTARGVIDVLYAGAQDIRKTLNVYLKDEDGNKIVYLYSKDFFLLKNAKRYESESLHVGTPVDVDFTVKSGPFWRFWHSTPFRIDRITQVNGDITSGSASTSTQDYSKLTGWAKFNKQASALFMLDVNTFRGAGLKFSHFITGLPLSMAGVVIFAASVTLGTFLLGAAGIVLSLGGMAILISGIDWSGAPK